MICFKCNKEYYPGNGPDICPYCNPQVSEEGSQISTRGALKTENRHDGRNWTSGVLPKTEYSHSGSFWISSMKAVVLCSFFGIIICGLMLAILLGAQSVLMGFLVFIASVIVAFLLTATEMIFLNLAQDVSEIKQKMNFRKE